MNVTPYQLDLATALSTAAGTIETRRGFVIKLPEQGGLGEAAPLPGWTESVSACRDALRQAQQEPTPSAALAAIDAKQTPAAHHGLALAVADARATAASQPLYQWLGGNSQSSVPVNATIGAGSIDDIVTAATEAVDAGYQTLKLKLGTTSVSQDLERIGAVEEAIPQSVSLRGDANAAWSRSEARQAFTALDGSSVTYIEQPLHPEALEAHQTLRTVGDVGVALDETLQRIDIETIIETAAADVVVLKPMALGGPMRTREVARIAQQASITPVVTTTIDGVIARLGALHVAASLPVTTACGLATASYLAQDLAPDPAPVASGIMHPPSTPGHGICEVTVNGC